MSHATPPAKSSRRHTSRILISFILGIVLCGLMITVTAVVAVRIILPIAVSRLTLELVEIASERATAMNEAFLKPHETLVSSRIYAN